MGTPTTPTDFVGGLTKGDFFAAIAMHAILQRDPTATTTVAKRAYDFAEMMIKEGVGRAKQVEAGGDDSRPPLERTC